jgi:hypothetical protein
MRGRTESLRYVLGLVNFPSGGCEKIGFRLTSDLQSKQLRARMPSKRLLRLGCTFRIKN